MDLHYKQELQVGALVLAAVVIVVVGLVWLSGRSFGGGAMTLDARFEGVQGLTIGDPVQISGVRVGRVADIRIERVGSVIVSLEVSRDFPPRMDAQVSVKSLDLLGAKFVDYRPGEASDPLPDDATLTGGKEGDMAAMAMGLADQAAGFLASGQDFLSGDMVAQVKNTMAAAERALDVVARLGSGTLAADADAAIAHLRSAAARLDSTLANPAIEKSVSQLDEITQGMLEMTEGLALVTTSLGSVMQKIDEGEGSLGLAINDPTLHDDMSAVLQALKELLDDIRENPGRYGPRSIKLF